MRLKKAIEILTLMGTPTFEGHTEDILKARQLGIEALKHIKDFRLTYNGEPVYRLRGETKG